MLTAVAEDLVQNSDFDLCMLWSNQLGIFPIPEVTTIPVDSPQEERESFRGAIAKARCSWILAPEENSILTERVELLEQAKTTFMGCSSECVALCADKLRLSQFLSQRNIPTIPTEQLTSDLKVPPWLPAVVKPRDGVGSQEMFLIQSLEDWNRLRSQLPVREMIIQPFLPGTPYSFAMICQGKEMLRYPLVKQMLSADSSLHYLGGELNTPELHAFPHETIQAAEQLAEQLFKAIPGLKGYVGVDILLSESNPGSITLVEVNPRLTTSYLGYRQACSHSLLSSLIESEIEQNGNGLFQSKTILLPDWTASQICFSAYDF